jgi:hypothetical protein
MGLRGLRRPAPHRTARRARRQRVRGYHGTNRGQGGGKLGVDQARAVVHAERLGPAPPRQRPALLQLRPASANSRDHLIVLDPRGGWRRT